MSRSFYSSTQLTKDVIEDIFGEYSFNHVAQQSYLSEKVANEVKRCVAEHKPLSPELVDNYAAALLRWAIDRGATHFTHWFVPINGRSAQKHDSFLAFQGDRVISKFSGKTLTIGEPDASSFPSGGLRATHEARGYTVWDPSSPPFILNHRTGATLYIPSVFFSWKGHPLDEKLPLLRANESLTKAALRMLRAAGDDSHSVVYTNSGVEQEFFLVDCDFVLRRPDLVQTGRTLVGIPPPRGQKLEDQYFADLSERTMKVINDAERELWKLGVPQTTRHKEVAPGQYEMAPVFSIASVASDQNIIVQEVINRVAHHHGMEAIFHEKPFAGLNGSGKHNNWSIGTDRIGTVFAPGPEPHNNLLFMIFIAATFRAVDLYADLLRISVASAANDHRLGANEAPPAIISAFLGDEITASVDKFIAGDDSPSNLNLDLDIGVKGLPSFKRDSTDRNRTSPFAFTGNKFEFRAVGGGQTPHRSNYILNTIVADSCGYIADEIEKKGATTKEEKEKAAKEVIREVLKKHLRIVFNGNAYSADWHAEAAKRGLPNLKNTPDSLERLVDPKNVDLFKRLNIFDAESLHARQEAWLEEYIIKVTVEAETLLSIVNTRVLPVVSSHLNNANATLNNCIVLTGEAKNAAQQRRVQNYAGLVEGLTETADKLKELAESVHHKGNGLEQAKFAAANVLPAMMEVRTHVDSLERLTPADQWPLPTYEDMLYSGQVYDVHPASGGATETAPAAVAPSRTSAKSRLWY